MGHLAIYRKYRPSNFEEVSGQKTIVNILKNAIKSNNISHAYLFTGPRGTGKTSIAKIFARTINCEALESTNPCNKCNSCLNSLSKECVDIIEIDAASNNGVDEIRELKSKINIVPSYLKYKIYIIDEVHMLSIGAFNALLKTLEEPPSHAIFILATTEIQKIPSTILSRCQTLEFKKISPIDMKKRITYICKNENINIDDDAVDEVIDVSDGCMRDALSFLEKITAFCNDTIHAEDVRIVSGKPPIEFIYDLISLINDGDIESIKKVNEAYLNDYDLFHIVEDIINRLDDLIFKEKNNNEGYRNMLSKFIEIYDKMKNSSVNGKIILEIELLNYFETNVRKNISREIFLDKKEPANKLEVTNIEINKNLKEDLIKNKTLEVKNANKKISFDDFKKIRINNTFVGADKEKLLNLKSRWNELNNYAFDKESGALICNLLDGIPVAANDKYMIVSYQYEIVADNINENYLNFENILEKYLSLEYNLVALSNEEWSKAKQEYVNKINQGDKYKMLQDNYCNEIQGSKKSEPEIKEQKIESNNVGDKIFELFDSEDIEIK